MTAHDSERASDPPPPPPLPARFYESPPVILGGMLLWAATPRSEGGAGVRPYLRSAALLVGSVAAGRLLSIVIDGVLSPLNLLFLAFELAVCVLSLLASAPRRPAAP